jgi:NAD(P)-dependent dehydrogenase (short-subunit alcohol dehydrogenase family)
MTPMGREVWGPEEKRAPMLAKTPLGRFGEPVEVADMALYLASPAAELVNGAVIMLEGGYTAV